MQCRIPVIKPPTVYSNITFQTHSHCAIYLGNPSICHKCSLNYSNKTMFTYQLSLTLVERFKHGTRRYCFATHLPQSMVCRHAVRFK